MSKRIFDFFSGDYLRKTSENTAVDDDGNMHIRIGSNMSIDLDNGELHITSRWNDEEED